MGKNGKFALVAGIIALFLVGGCATMISGTDQSVTFSSMPKGATVNLDGQSIGTTPLLVKIPRKSDNIVTFTMDGYKPQEVNLDSTMNPWVIANVIWCMSCVFSTTTDVASGAAYQYAPDKYFVTLVPENYTETPTDIQKRTVKSFIVGNYDSILSELNGVSSEYLETLLDMLEIEKDERKLAIGEIKTISSNETDILIFADEVIKEFINE